MENSLTHLMAITDIKNKVLRHVSDAFIEDPLRLFRVARFSATLNFKVHQETEVLLKEYCELKGITIFIKISNLLRIH